MQIQGSFNNSYGISQIPTTACYSYSTDTEATTHNISLQGLDLRKTTRSPRVPNHEILGAQHRGSLRVHDKKSFSSHPKENVSSLWHEGNPRAQSCLV